MKKEQEKHYDPLTDLETQLDAIGDAMDAMRMILEEDSSSPKNKETKQG